jgi:early secretory antigenic target protein ESAT-6
MTRFQVDSEAVLVSAGAVRATISRLEAEVSALHGQLLGLQSSWTGPAASVFQSTFGEWKVTEQRVADDLSRIDQALSLAGQQYAEAETSYVRLFHR